MKNLLRTQVRILIADFASGLTACFSAHACSNAIALGRRDRVSIECAACGRAASHWAP